MASDFHMAVISLQLESEKWPFGHFQAVADGSAVGSLHRSVMKDQHNLLISKIFSYLLNIDFIFLEHGEQRKYSCKYISSHNCYLLLLSHLPSCSIHRSTLTFVYSHCVDTEFCTAQTSLKCISSLATFQLLVI